MKRYWHPDHCHTDDDAVTLVTAHAISFSKEHWEPTLKHLYERFLAQTTLRVKVRDVWCIDAPNHGHAAVLNEQTLTYYYNEECEYASFMAIYKTYTLLYNLLGRICSMRTCRAGGVGYMYRCRLQL